MSEVCPECGQEFKNVSYHWRGSPSHRPTVTRHQEEVITGVLMGDGCLNRDPTNPRLTVSSITKEYLDCLNDTLGILSAGILHELTPEEAAKRDRESGFNAGADPDDYSDKYALRTRCHPYFNRYKCWYNTGEKQFPDSIDLTPTTLKHWFVGDGTYDNAHNQDRIQLSMVNERRNKDKIEHMFESVGLPAPSNWNESKQRCSAVWTATESEQLFEYMGEPISGFAYKWPS